MPLDRYAALYNLVARDARRRGLRPLRGADARRQLRIPVPRRRHRAPTLADALERCGRFLRVVLPDLAVALRRAAGVADAAPSPKRRPLADGADDPGRVFAFEWLLRLLHGLACWLVGRGIALDSVSFPYAPPGACRRLRADLHRALANSAPPCSEASSTPTCSTCPSVATRPRVSLFLTARRARSPLLYRRDREMVMRVRDLLRAALPANLDLDEVAAQLHLSPRTLHRRLADEGASFRSIKDALRRDLALARLPRAPSPSRRSPPTSATPTPRPSSAPSPTGPAWRPANTGSGWSAQPDSTASSTGQMANGRAWPVNSICMRAVRRERRTT